jgi:hypothetical protein
MVYRRKGSGEPPSRGKALGSEEPSRSDEPPSTRGTDSAPGRKAGALRQGSGPASVRTPKARLSAYGPKSSEELSSTRCAICGHRTFLVGLPGRTDKYCFECSADVATSVLLKTEIDAATLAGQDANPLVAEFEQLSTRLLARAQSA